GGAMHKDIGVAKALLVEHTVRIVPATRHITVAAMRAKRTRPAGTLLRVMKFENHSMWRRHCEIDKASNDAAHIDAYKRLPGFRQRKTTLATWLTQPGHSCLHPLRRTDRLKVGQGMMHAQGNRNWQPMRAA